MFSKRPDGNLLKNLDPFSKIVPYIMYARNDATNMMFEEVDCRPMDEYIRAQAAAGVERTYMQVLIASMVRTMYQRPQLNRFVIRGKTYQRNSIVVSFVVHRSLRGTSEETTIKLHFKGDETLSEIADKISAAIDETVQEGNQNSTDKLAKIVTSVPYCIIWFIVKFLSLLDRHNLMPKSIVEASPFHSSFFITNLKSLGIDTIFHHIYNFGTTSQFISLGKEKYKAVVVGKEHVEIKKILQLGIVTDERICDGLYYARSTKLMKKYIHHPAMLEERPAPPRQ